MVPVEGIEPPLLAEHDFESCASTSSATRALALDPEKLVPDAIRVASRFSGKITRQKSPLYIRAPAASMARRRRSFQREERCARLAMHRPCIGAPDRQIAVISGD